MNTAILSGGNDGMPHCGIPDGNAEERRHAACQVPIGVRKHVADERQTSPRIGHDLIGGTNIKAALAPGEPHAELSRLRAEVSRRIAPEVIG